MNKHSVIPSEISGWRTIALGIGGILTIVLLAIAVIFPDQREQVLRSWLLGFSFWGGISIGSLGLLLMQYLTGGAWGVIIRRIVEASSRTLLMSFIIFIPLLLGVSYFYQWAHPNLVPEELKYRAGYLNPFSWGLRAICYFVIWGIMAFLLNKWSKRQDETGEFEWFSRMTRFSGPSLVIWVLVVSFAGIDWIMSLDQHFYSTIFGLLYVIGWALSALAFTILILAWLSDRAPMDHIVGKKIFHDLGKLMLAMVMIWAYFNFSQFLIIWSGNIPEETKWYLARMSGAWGAIGLILILFHFAFPFLLLLSRDLKRNTKWIAILSIFILVMRVVDTYYFIGPAPMLGAGEHAMSFHVSWMDFVAPVAVGGIWLWWFFGELIKRPLVPINDPFLENAINHGKGH
ncbi:MAG: hypothetical protein ACR2N3_04650 [Pyrinomonadaceae bacterium]